MRAKTPWGRWWRLCRIVCRVLGHQWEDEPGPSPFPVPAEYCPRCLRSRPMWDEEEPA